MKHLLFLTIFFTFCFSSSIEDIYKNALILEKGAQYKEAMLLYKKALDLQLSNQNNTKDKDNKKLEIAFENKNHEVETFSKMKSDFYTKKINKTNNAETNSTIKQIITGNFGLFPYRKNYLIPVSYDLKEKENRNQLETYFQFSIEKPISYDFFGLDESISTAYTQKSFWQTNKNSSPFRETNYSPEIFIQFPYKNSETVKGYKVSLIHESNGKNDLESRSWNRIYLESYLQLSNVFIIPRIWYRIPEKSQNDDNPDIYDYYGYGDLRLLYPYKKHTFELKLRNNLKLTQNNKGAAQLDWTFPLPEFMSTVNSYGFMQIFSGYGESLIDYDKEIHKIGFGIAFSR
ncbi:phospholipase A [Poseidonibacter sp.]|uniref:phospholipase A n=1 Tax=Poseidonibacter sp. TaxID=2321188 RepID=UPI003C71ABCF